MAPKRKIIGGLASVLLHGGLLAWTLRDAPEPEPKPEPKLAAVAIERIDVQSMTDAPRAWEAAEGLPGHDASPSPTPAHGEAFTPNATREPEPAAPRTTPEPRPTAPLRSPTSTTPSAPAAATATAPAPALPLPAPEGPPIASATVAPGEAGPATAVGTSDGPTGNGTGHMGTGAGPNYSAYGAELVRLVKAEIDIDPIPGLRPRDSIEVVLEVLPNGRLARRGMGKLDHARVIHSTVGPLRTRAILRRILRASSRFPPHPPSFPRSRYVVGFTVHFNDRHG